MAQLPAYNSDNSNQQSSGRGGRAGQSFNNSGGRQRAGLPYLKIENVSQDFKKAKIMATQVVPDRTDGSRKFSDIQIKIYYNGQIYLWGLKFTHPVYGALLDFFGSDTDHWQDQEFMLGLELDEFSGRPNLRVAPVDKPVTTGRKK